MAKIDEARFVILQNGFMSAGACGVFKALVPIPWLEIGALTWATRNMCDRLVQIYDYENLPGMDDLISNAIGSATEAKLVSGLLDVVPGFNIGTNAVATFTLQTVTGIIITSICELLDERALSQESVKHISTSTIRNILSTVTSVVGEFARANYHDAIQIVKAEFCPPLLEEDDVITISAEDYVQEELQQCILLATADAAEEIAEDIGLLNQPVAEEDVSDYSVADVLGYNDFVKYVYATYLDSLQPGQPQDDIIAAAGATYQEIYERNCREGLWSKRQGFDDTLAFYVAGYLKEKTDCPTLLHSTQETVAYELSKYLKSSVL